MIEKPRVLRPVKDGYLLYGMKPYPVNGQEQMAVGFVKDESEIPEVLRQIEELEKAHGW